MSLNFSDILAGLGQVAGTLNQAGIGGSKDQKHIAQAGLLLSLISFVLSYHPQSPVNVTAADGAIVPAGTTVTPIK